ncbi:MAG: hypothetical protein AAB888_00860 [Patescibacteria group bacterium]
MSLFFLSLVLLAGAMFGFYVWGEHKSNFDEKVFVLLIFIFGVVFMTYAGYDFGTGHPVKASRILGKGGVYFLETVINKDSKIYATVTDEYGSVYAVIFDKSPPAKFKVVEDKNGQIYMAIP